MADKESNGYSLGGLADWFTGMFGSSTPKLTNGYQSVASPTTFNTSTGALIANAGNGINSIDGTAGNNNLTKPIVNTETNGLAGMLGNAKSMFDIGSSIYGIYNTNKLSKATIDNYKNAQRIANNNEARTQEMYDTFKADKAALNAGYAGNGATRVG